jgi:hypothetical protein
LLSPADADAADFRWLPPLMPPIFRHFFRHVAAASFSPFHCQAACLLIFSAA